MLLGAVSSRALAAEALLYAPEGSPRPGARAPIEVAVAEGPFPVRGALVEVEVSRGRIVAFEGEVAPGRYRFRYQAGPEPGDDAVTVKVNGAVAARPPLRIRPFARTGLSGAAEVDAAIGTPRVELRFPLEATSGAAAPGDFVVRGSEGRVVDVAVGDDAVVVGVEPGSDRFARALAVAVLDRRAPGAEPVFGLIRLRARPQLALTAEPGSVATLRVGRRAYGPFIADAAGAIALSFDVWPGETSYELSVSDDLGNTQKSQGPLATSPRPLLVGLEAPSAASGSANLFLGAWTAAGGPWTGAAPACLSGEGVRQDAVSVGRGVYALTVGSPTGAASFFDAQIGCALAEAAVAFRVAARTEGPERIDLRAYPEALSADFPIAQVQATLVDARGERLPPGAIRMSAERGEIVVSEEQGSLRGEYRGAAAVAAGGDHLSAAWDQTMGTGLPWSIRLHASPDGDAVVVVARVFDGGGHPLAGVPVTFTAAGSGVTEATDARGWAQGRLPGIAEAGVVAATAGETGSERVVFRGAVDALPNPTLPDLTAGRDLVIHAGRVRAVYIDAQPRPLMTGAGQSATVVVRMLDAQGNPVRDEVVSIVADQGLVGIATPRADGALEANYMPPPGAIARTVRITANTSAGSYATDLELVPRPVRGSVAIGAGWLTNFDTVSSPTFQILASTRLPVLPDVLASRIAINAYVLRTTVEDPLAGADVSLSATMIPIELGVQGVQRFGPRSIQAGLSAVVTPYYMAVDYGTERGINGVALASPGLSIHGGGAWRIGGSELFTEARFLLFTASSSNVAFDGSVGGLSLTAGYRVLY